MVDKLSSIRNKQSFLTTFKSTSTEVIDKLSQWFKLETIYSSNAISGSNMSRMETMQVLEKSIAVGGKTLIEHYEIVNHALAYGFIISLMNRNRIEETDLIKIHQLLQKNIDEENAGQYRVTAPRFVGSPVVLPDPAKVPKLIADFINNINNEKDTISKALKAHYALVTIHPFKDGNGKTARLIMNLLLMQGGYPPAFIKPKDKAKYLKSLELAQTGESLEPFTELVLESIERSLNIFIKAVKGDDLPSIKARESLIKIGELAKETNESLSTLRYWVKRGLIEVSDTAESGYQFFDKGEIIKCRLIRRLQDERLTLEEVQKRLDNEMVG